MDWVQWEYDIAMAMAFYFIFFLPGFSWFLGVFFFLKRRRKETKVRRVSCHHP